MRKEVKNDFILLFNILTAFCLYRGQYIHDVKHIINELQSENSFSRPAEGNINSKTHSLICRFYIQWC